MKKCDTSLSLVPHNCLVFLILSATLADKKRVPIPLSAPVQISCISEDYFTSSYLIPIGYQTVGYSWYRFGTKTGVSPHIFTCISSKNFFAKVRRKSDIRHIFYTFLWTRAARPPPHQLLQTGSSPVGYPGSVSGGSPRQVPRQDSSVQPNYSKQKIFGQNLIVEWKYDN